MTAPADLDQLCHAVSLQGATLRSHEELLLALLEGLRSLTECHDQGFKAIKEPRLPPPERNSGDPGTCRGCDSQCSLIFELQPSSFPSDRLKIAYLIPLMSGRVLSWATAVWEQQSDICRHLEDFMEEVRKVFLSPVSGREAAHKMLYLCQNSRGGRLHS